MSDIILKLKNMSGFTSLSSAAEEKITQAEEALNLTVSDEYREYVTVFGVVSFDGHEFTGICLFPRLNVADVTISERISNPTIPLNWYVVEQANIDGIVVWQSSAGEVWQTMPGSPPVKLCESLCEYLELLQSS